MHPQDPESSLSQPRLDTAPDITVVRGYKKEAVTLPNLTYLDNDEFAETGELYSLDKALRARKGGAKDLIISYGDVLFNKYIPQALCQEKEDFVIFVDSDWQNQSSYARLGGFAGALAARNCLVGSCECR